MARLQTLAFKEFTAKCFGVYPDDPSDAPFAPGTFFDDTIQVYTIVDQMFVYRFKKLRQVLGRGPLAI